MQDYAPAVTAPEPTYEAPIDDVTTLDAVASRYLEGVHYEPGFIQSCAEKGIDASDATTVEYATAFRSYVQEEIALRLEEGLLDPQLASLMQLGADFAASLHAEREAQRMLRNKRQWTRADKTHYYDTLRPQFITFNNDLSQYLYENPPTQMRDLSLFIKDSSSLMLGALDSDEVSIKISELIKGARTEAIAAHIFDQCHVPYTKGTAEEDARGGDLVIHLGESRILVDLKSSLTGLSNENTEAAADAIEQGKLYIVTGKNRFKFLLVSPGSTAEVTISDAESLIIATQLQRACNEAMSVDK
ncbi:hypothetical protein KBD87_04705 [Candidatus Saccharibacteria bacterium]|jgi:hypothetical protein|nr:hypothetical protein [Candidatus Saccharibacteria bacterium]